MSNTIHITAATVRVEKKYTYIDAVVNGKFEEAFVLYDGTSNAHIAAAFDYLTNQVGLHCDDIQFEDWSEESFEEWDDRITKEIEQGLDEYASQYAHACGYID